MFGRKSRAEKLREEVQGNALGATLATALGGARPIAERLLYDDDLRDNIRSFIEASRKILNELSDEDAPEIAARLWDDDKLRSQVEAAVGAAQEGAKRVRGKKVKSGGFLGGRVLLLLILAGGAFLFLNPKTGPQARRIAGDIVGALRS